MKRIIFLSDLHARPDKPERERLFVEFLHREGAKCDALYLLGDIFEFGFVFRGRILAYYEPLLEEILKIKRSGIEIYFLAGNHDLWMSSYLRRKGIRIIHDGEVREIWGRKVTLFHGLLKERDALSRFARRVMFNPDSVWLYSLLPHRLGFRLALKASYLSSKRHLPFSKRHLLSSFKELDPKAEFVISGHHHEPLHFFSKAREFFVTGDWVEDFTYLEMTPDGLDIKTYR